MLDVIRASARPLAAVQFEFNVQMPEGVTLFAPNGEAYGSGGFCSSCHARIANIQHRAICTVPPEATKVLFIVCDRCKRAIDRGGQKRAAIESALSERIRFYVLK